MMKQEKLILPLLLCALMLVVVLGVTINKNKSKPTAIITENGSITEINHEIIVGEKRIDSMREAYDLKSMISGESKTGLTYHSCIFQGIVEDFREYEVSWKDETYGDIRGPFSRTIIDVKLTKDSEDVAKKAGEIVKVLVTNSLSFEEENSIRMEKGQEYIFINCWLLDELYRQNSIECGSDSVGNDKSLDLADVIVGPFWNSLIPVNNDICLVYHEFIAGSNLKALTDQTAEQQSFSEKVLTVAKDSPQEEFIYLSTGDVLSYIKELIQEYRITKN